MLISQKVFVLEKWYNYQNTQENVLYLYPRENYMHANRNIVKNREMFMPRILPVLQYAFQTEICLLYCTKLMYTFSPGHYLVKNTCSELNLFYSMLTKYCSARARQPEG